MVSSASGIHERPRYLAETIRPRSGESYDWHTHDFGQLISANSGSMYVGVADRVLLLSPAMTIWIPPDVDHWMRYGANNEMLYVDVNRHEARCLGEQSRVFILTPLLGALMSATTPDKQANRSHHHTEIVHDLLREELVAARDIPLSVAMPRDRRIQGLAQMALSEAGASLSVESWLSGAPASRKTIERLFIRDTGITPARWLRHVRVIHSISRLAAGDKLSSVALDLGYESASAFTYMFRTIIGVSPSKFLKLQGQSKIGGS